MQGYCIRHRCLHDCNEYQINQEGATERVSSKARGFTGASESFPIAEVIFKWMVAGLLC